MDLLFGVLPKEVLEGGIVVVFSIYTLWLLFKLLTKSEESNTKSITFILTLLDKMVDKFSTSIDKLSAVTTKFNTTVDEMSRMNSEGITDIKTRVIKIETQNEEILEGIKAIKSQFDEKPV